MIRTATAPHLSRLPGRTRRHWLVAAAEMAGLASGNAWSSPDSALRGRPRLPRVAVRSLGADAESVRVARNFTVATLCRWDTAQRSQDVVIVVSELLTNALRHALPAVGQARLRRPVQLGLLQLGHCVLCAVADPGQAVPAPRTPGSEDQTGRGLSIICALSDQWGYTTPSEAGKVVWATFYSRLTRPAARSRMSSRAYAATVESSVIRPSPIISSNLARDTQAWHMSCSSCSRSGAPGSSPVARK